MDIQFFQSASHTVAIIRDSGIINRYLITCAQPDSFMGEPVWINGRGYYIDRVSTAFANAIEQNANYVGLEDIKPHMLIAVTSFHNKG
jgi:hypothetical protein